MQNMHFFNSKSLSFIREKSLPQCHPCSFDPQSGYKTGTKNLFRIQLLSILRSFRYFPKYDTTESKCRRTSPPKYCEYCTSHNTKWTLWYRTSFPYHFSLALTRKHYLTNSREGELWQQLKQQRDLTWRDCFKAGELTLKYATQIKVDQ